MTLPSLALHKKPLLNKSIQLSNPLPQLLDLMYLILHGKLSLQFYIINLQTLLCHLLFLQILLSHFYLIFMMLTIQVWKLPIVDTLSSRFHRLLPLLPPAKYCGFCIIKPSDISLLFSVLLLDPLVLTNQVMQLLKQYHLIVLMVVKLNTIPLSCNLTGLKILTNPNRTVRLKRLHTLLLILLGLLKHDLNLTFLTVMAKLTLLLLQSFSVDYKQPVEIQILELRQSGNYLT